MRHSQEMGVVVRGEQKYLLYWSAFQVCLAKVMEAGSTGLWIPIGCAIEHMIFEVGR
jgi:hypothetical protein